MLLVTGMDSVLVPFPGKDDLLHTCLILRQNWKRKMDSLGFPGHFKDTWFLLGYIISGENLLNQKVFPELNTVLKSTFLAIDAIIHLKELAYQ